MSRKEKTNFSKFLGVNGLTHKYISGYLGIPLNTVTKYSSGERILPNDVKIQLLANNFGWDTSLLDGKPVVTSDVEKARLIDENNGLRERIKHLESTNERYLSMIETLTDRLSSAVHDMALKAK